MKLLVIRHAIAMDAEEFADKGESDDRRPLTPYGAKRMRKNTKGLRTLVEKIDSFGTSPYTRAIETAEIISEVYGRDQAELCASLVPGIAFEDFEEWARTFTDSEVLAIVGHEPHLSTLVSWLLFGASESRMQLKKGGACLVDFESTPQRNSGTLLWLLTPRQLRGLA
ncbi:MAG TPA: phosphohistidine phosphatase SixA [Gemmatimonadaceae bacterium]|jgi:phosphohistidine phosphatase